MNNWIWILTAAVILCAFVFVLLYRWHVKKTMDTLEKMLDTAMKGTFSEDFFDESRLSALETKFAHYFSASAISAKNVEEEKNKIKKLVADISHQTKTPIANLLLYCELLQEEDLSESAQSYADALHGQTEKLRFLIDSLVKLSRLENGIISLSVKHQKLYPMLETVVNQYSFKAEQKGLYLHLEPTDAAATFDAKWTAEALGNIVDNAVKYTEHGGIAITVKTYEMFVRIDVTDSGIGISETEQAQIFSRFYRSEQVREQNGVGIGLYLAREVISYEGGYIKVSSEPGKGSVFSVFLSIS